jgi:hypothetical protein
VGDFLQCGDATARAADALMRANGGRAVWLRTPAPAVANDDAEQLGLAVPGFQDVELSPVVLRKAGNTTTLLVSGSAVNAVVGSLQFNSAQVLFETAAGVVMDEVLYTILDHTASTSDGKTYSYSLTLRAPER